MHNFRKLKVYKKAIDFTVLIYKLTKSFPKEEIFGLTSQMRRAVTSVSLNIAEGNGNKSNKELKRFIEISLRSNYEVMTCLEIALKLNYCKKGDYQKLTSESDEIAAMLVGFSKQL